ncbi:hypothetical protein [Ornithinimicrobium cerasi]|uniref:hypothetical protein n=1 Tax=Ornithinimicrobium cerasi TaxID=2248773 RepID=UPI000EFE4223|nr:hypothetical protein [Ornithinimicrobium cerasi]
MWHLVPLFASLSAFGGTLMQAYVNLSRLKELDPEGTKSFNTVDGFRTEYRPSRNPIRWAKSQSVLRQLLAESPAEAELYNRVRLQLWSWVLLVLASAAAVGTTAFGLL